MPAYPKLNTSHFLEFDKGNKKYENGVFKLQLNSWDEFHSVAKKFENYPDYIWRGQEKRYDELIPSFYRRDVNKETIKEELDITLEKFKKRLSGVRKIDSFTDNDVWAIGQHYGLKTPLLDWTEIPYFAAYFAFYNKKEKKEDGVIYALNRAIKRLMKRKDRFVDFDLPNDKFDDQQNRRLINQKGKFTFALDGKSIESIVSLYWKYEYIRKENNDEDIILAEISIPGKYRDEYMGALGSMNINHGILFPDYAGAVEITKIDLGIKDCCCFSGNNITKKE